MPLRNKPGLLIISDISAERIDLSALTERFGSDDASEYQWAYLGDRLAARVCSRWPENYSVEHSPNGLIVLFEGYLSDYTGSKPAGFSLKRPANGIRELYAEMGLKFVKQLRGSYTCLIIDSTNDIAHMLNDRSASRPSFFSRSGDGALRMAPEISLLIAMDQHPRNLSMAGLGAFLIRGYNYGDHTLFEEFIRFRTPAWSRSGEMGLSSIDIGSCVIVPGPKQQRKMN